MLQDGKKHSTMSNLKSCLNIVFECALDDDIYYQESCKEFTSAADREQEADGHRTVAD